MRSSSIHFAPHEPAGTVEVDGGKHAPAALARGFSGDWLSITRDHTGSEVCLVFHSADDFHAFHENLLEEAVARGWAASPSEMSVDARADLLADNFDVNELEEVLTSMLHHRRGSAASADVEAIRDRLSRDFEAASNKLQSREGIA